MSYVLVSGGAGYIGTHTCVELLKNNCKIIIVDDFRNSKPEAIQRLKRISGKDFLFFQLDVSDINALDKVFSTYKIDSIIHFAGLKAVGESVQKPLYYYNNNLRTTLALLECMQKYNTKSIIFSSSATVYGIPKHVPLIETDDLWCTNPYGWTKFMSEQIIRDFLAANPSFSAVLLRYFNPVGAHESGLIGEDPRDIPNNLMPYINKVAVGAFDHLNVFGDDYPTPDGTGVRDYIHVTDLAQGHLCALKFAANHNGIETFNLGTGIGYSVLDMIKTYERVNGVKIPYIITERRAGDVPQNYADTTKADSILGWHALANLENMCATSYNWIKNNPNGY